MNIYCRYVINAQAMPVFEVVGDSAMGLAQWEDVPLFIESGASKKRRVMPAMVQNGVGALFRSIGHPEFNDQMKLLRTVTINHLTNCGRDNTEGTL